MKSCKICRTQEAVVPEGEQARYCAHCWESRLKQLYQAEDRFRAQRTIRTSEAEKYFVFHDAVKKDDGLCALVICLHDVLADHLDVNAYLFDVVNWDDPLPIIYQDGVETELDQLDVFLGFLEGDIISSWRTRSWSAEVTRCVGQSFWIDSREPDAPPDEPHEP